MNGSLFDPSGVVEADRTPVSPRVDDLNGKTLGVLNNTKWNSSKLLRASIHELEELGVKFAAINFYDKHHFSSDADPELLDRIAAENDIAVTAIGDCGSCTSSCVNDAIQLELRGTPSAVIVTTEFEREAMLQRAARGMPDLEPIVIAHPVSSLTTEQLQQRALDVAPQAISIWTLGDPAPADLQRGDDD